MLSLKASSNDNEDIIDSIQRKELVPTKTLAPLLKSHVLKERERGRKKLLIDGFPRRLDQAAPVEALVRLQSNPLWIRLKLS